MSQVEYIYNHSCTNCGKPITYRFAICADCEKTFGNIARFWPDWLREGWNMTQRERRRTIAQLKNEVSFGDLEKSINEN